MNVAVDSTTQRLAEMLKDTISVEPTYDPDTLGAHGIAEAELQHYEWQRHCAALRLLVGVRLTENLLAEL